MTMMTFDASVLLQALLMPGFILLGATTFRLRGSGLWDALTGTGTTGGRLQYAVQLGLAGAVYGGDWRLLGLVPALFAGCIPPWFSDGLVPATPLRMVANALRGALWLAPAAVPFWWCGYDPDRMVLVAGMLSGPIYGIAWLLSVRPVIWRGEVLIGTGTELAEVLFGGWIGFCIWWVLSA